MDLRNATIHEPKNGGNDSREKNEELGEHELLLLKDKPPFLPLHNNTKIPRSQARLTGFPFLKEIKVQTQQTLFLFAFLDLIRKVCLLKDSFENFPYRS